MYHRGRNIAIYLDIILSFQTIKNDFCFIYCLLSVCWDAWTMFESSNLVFVVCYSITQLCPTLRPHGLQHTMLPCPSLSPWVCWNSCPLSWWYHPTVSSSVVPFSSWPQSFPASGSFQMSWLFESGGQSIGASASAPVLPISIQGWFPLGLIGLISFLSKGLSWVFSSITVWKHQFFSTQPSLWSNSHILYMTAVKTMTLTIRTFVSKVMSLLFNMLSRFVIAFLPRSKRLLISRLQALSTALQQFVNWELPDVQAGFRKGRRTRDQIANIRWIIEKAREFQKNIYFCFIDYAKASDCVDHNKLWKILKEIGIPDYLTCLLRSLVKLCYWSILALQSTQLGVLHCVIGFLANHLRFVHRYS